MSLGARPLQSTGTGGDAAVVKTGWAPRREHRRLSSRCKKEDQAMSLGTHMIRAGCAAALTLALAGVATAQMPQRPGPATAPPPPAGAPAQLEVPRTSSVEGAVKKVDAGAGT